MAHPRKVVNCCPDCGSVDLNRRVGGEGDVQRRSGDADKKYWCRNCQTGCDYPAEKEIVDKQHSHGSDLVAAALEADVDDVLGGSA